MAGDDTIIGWVRGLENRNPQAGTASGNVISRRWSTSPAKSYPATTAGLLTRRMWP